MQALKFHLRYWMARFGNELRQITFRRPTEKGVVDEVMNGLKRNPQLRKAIEDAEAERGPLGKTVSKGE